MSDQILLSKLRQVSRHCTKQIRVFEEARNQIQETIRKIKNYKPQPTGDISIETIAEMLGKEKLSAVGKLKAVKRATIGIKPTGKNRVDYHKIFARKTHVKDKTAHYVGQEIYVYVQRRTKFKASDVRHLWPEKPGLLTDEQIEQLQDEIRVNMQRLEFVLKGEMQ